MMNMLQYCSNIKYLSDQTVVQKQKEKNIRKSPVSKSIYRFLKWFITI